MEFNTLNPSRVYQSSKLVKSLSVGTMSTLRTEHGQRGPFVDRGVGHPRIVKCSSLKSFTTNLSLEPDTKVCINEFNFVYYSTSIFNGNLLLLTVICVLLQTIASAPPFLDRIHFQQRLELLQLVPLLIRCWDPRRINIWRLSWYFSSLRNN